MKTPTLVMIMQVLKQVTYLHPGNEATPHTGQERSQGLIARLVIHARMKYMERNRAFLGVKGVE